MGDGPHAGSPGWLAGAIAGVLLLLDGQAAHAARLLKPQVERDGKVVLKAMTEDDSQSDPGVVWTCLRRVSFEAVGDIPAHPSDPLRATLTGNMRVAILGGPSSGGKLSTEAIVTELHLVRDSAHSSRWRLAPGEVERTAAAGGIQLPRPRWWPVVAIGGAAVVSLGAVSLWLSRRRGRAGGRLPSAEPGDAADGRSV